MSKKLTVQHLDETTTEFVAELVSNVDGDYTFKEVVEETPAEETPAPEVSEVSEEISTEPEAPAEGTPAPEAGEEPQA